MHIHVSHERYSGVARRVQLQYETVWPSASVLRDIYPSSLPEVFFVFEADE